METPRKTTEERVKRELKEFAEGLEVSPGLAKIWAKLLEEKEDDNNSNSASNRHCGWRIANVWLSVAT